MVCGVCVWERFAVWHLRGKTRAEPEAARNMGKWIVNNRETKQEREINGKLMIVQIAFFFCVTYVSRNLKILE